MTAPAGGAESVEPVVPAFDQARVVLVPGAGVVARYPGILAVFGGSDPAQLLHFLEICAQVSASGARSPGRRLARQLGAWLGGLDDQLCLGTVSATDGGLAVLLSGPASVEVPGESLTLSGASSAAWLDRIVDWPTSALVLSVSAEVAAPAEQSPFDLRAGVVPGSAAVFFPVAAEMVAPETAAPEMVAPEMVAAEMVAPEIAEPDPVGPARIEPEAADDPVADPEPEPAEPGPAEPALVDPPQAPPLSFDPEPPPPFPAAAPLPPAPAPPSLPAPELSARIDGADVAVPPRPPLPLRAAPELSEASAANEPPQVQGFLCSRGHLNDPRALFCGLCGIRMAERTGILTIGRRPPLGLLVFDDGVTFTVDAGYLLGRDPESDDRVRDGALRPLMLVDRRGAVSRRHAEITLDGWTVLLADAGSANGTFVSPRGSDVWSALVPMRPVPLEAGTRIRMGGRMMVFESPHGGP
jgi:hypothetical protein